MEVAVVLAAGVALALFVLRGRSGRADGVLPVTLFAALAVVTGLSTAWSVSPGDTIEEAARTFTYLAVFGVAVVAAHVRPRAAPVVVIGVLLTGVAICGWALLTRVFPAALAENVLGARLGEPFGYWNALGGVAVISLPAALWLGSRRTDRAIGPALAYPATGVLLLTLLLTQSRGGLAAAVVVALLWLLMVPLRLRSVLVLAVPALAMAPIASWALSKAAFTQTFQPLPVRESVAGDFGLMLLALCLGLAVAGLVVQGVRTRRAPSLAVRRRAGLTVAALACLAALVTVGSVALTDRGLTGAVSEGVSNLTSEDTNTPRGAARLGSVSSSRAGYWRQAWEVFEEKPLIGRGANSFGIARLPHRREPRAADQAHGYLAQTLADLGLLGCVIVLALLAAWLTTAGRATGLLPRRRPRATDGPERGALMALTLCAVGFGAQSAIDWTWFVPGPTVAALVAAGFVAGRGALPAVGAPTVVGVARPAGALGPRALAAAAVLMTAGLCAWAVWQPERAARATERASELLDEGDTVSALRQVRRARAIDPYSPAPLYAQAEVYAQQGEIGLAYRTYEIAIMEHPRDPDAWLRLASYELSLGLPERTLATLQGAIKVDPYSARVPPLAKAAQDAARALAPPPEAS
ncbi:MAG: O-antigen ligase family protein [Thermoleophilaceae bacterium]